MVNQNPINVLLIDETLSSTTLQDRISVPSQRTLTDGGQMHVPCKFARTGAQRYLASQVFRTQALLDQEGLKPNDVITLHRDEDTVFDEKSMETFRSAPVTIGHPKDDKGVPIAVTSANSKELQVGVLEGMPVRDEDTLGGTLVLTAQEAIDALEDGTQELSAGYGCDIVKIGKDYYQRNVRANHIAIVPKGRAGSSCRISDEAMDARLEDDHPEPMRWDFMNDEAYENAMKCWRLVEANEFAGSTDANGKAAGNTGVVDEAMAESLKALSIGVADGLTVDEAVELLTTALKDSQAEVVTQKELVVGFKEQTEQAEIKTKQLEVELADAKLAASEDVIERCEVIENARLIADMRDLGDKSVNEIKKLVVEDQNPDKDYSGKSDAYFDAMFEILVDASKGETPMSKLIKQQETHITIDARPVSKVEEARNKMIKRQQNAAK